MTVLAYRGCLSRAAWSVLTGAPGVCRQPRPEDEQPVYYCPRDKGHCATLLRHAPARPVGLVGDGSRSSRRQTPRGSESDPGEICHPSAERTFAKSSTRVACAGSMCGHPAHRFAPHLSRVVVGVHDEDSHRAGRRLRDTLPLASSSSALPFNLRPLQRVVRACSTAPALRRMTAHRARTGDSCRRFRERALGRGVTDFPRRVRCPLVSVDHPTANRRLPDRLDSRVMAQ